MPLVRGIRNYFLETFVSSFDEHGVNDPAAVEALLSLLELLPDHLLLGALRGLREMCSRHEIGGATNGVDSALVCDMDDVALEIGYQLVRQKHHLVSEGQETGGQLLEPLDHREHVIPLSSVHPNHSMLKGKDNLFEF